MSKCRNVKIIILLCIKIPLWDLASPGLQLTGYCVYNLLKFQSIGKPGLWLLLLYSHPFQHQMV